MSDGLIRFNAEKLVRNLADTVMWQLRGRTMPPPHFVKRRALREYAKCFGIRTLVETGTYRGYMISSLRGEFDMLYSIEVQDALFEAAKLRFARYPEIEILHGDSGQVLPELLKRLTTPALFWLDGHWSGGMTGKGEKDTPVVEELQSVLSHAVTNHVILIDDARLFDGTNTYPTMPQLEEMVRTASGGRYRVATASDIIRITPAG